MTHVVERGSYRIAVSDPVVFGAFPAPEVMALCAAGSRNGSSDAVDLALVAAAQSEAGIPYAQGGWSGPSFRRKYSVTQLKSLSTGQNVRVARGDLDSLLALANETEPVREHARTAIARLKKQGYVGVGVAAAEPDGAWRFAGVVPLRVTRTQQRVVNVPAEFRYVHVWDWPLRVLHWSWVLLIATLAVTGLMISEAWLLKTGDLTNGFAFGWIRLVHYTCGWLLASVLVMRAGRLFFGSNKYSRWGALVPVSFRSLKDTVVSAKHYLLMESWKNPRYIGHNPLQQWAYTGLLALLVAMACTGFAIYALYEPRNWFFGTFMFLNRWIGSGNVRLLHSIGMWIILIFVPAHIYLSVLSGNLDREGTVSSMVSGGRWLRRGVHFVDE